MRRDIANPGRRKHKTHTMTDDLRLPSAPRVFFRRQDQMVCSEYARRIATEGMSLVIHSHHPVCVEHYAALLYDQLAALPGIRLETLPGQGSEQVVYRFNQIVASMRVSDALATGDSGRPTTVLFCRGLTGENQGEWRMLMRLVRNFPGANVQLILLQSGPDDPGWNQTPEYFSKWMLRWSVPVPTLEQAQEVLSNARQSGIEEEAKSLLRSIDPGILRRIAVHAAALLPAQPFTTAPSSAQPLPQADARPTELPHLNARESLPSERPSIPTAVPAARAGRPLVKGILAAVAVLMISACIVLLLFPRHARVLRDAFLPTGEAPRISAGQSGLPSVVTAPGAVARPATGQEALPAAEPPAATPNLAAQMHPPGNQAVDPGSSPSDLRNTPGEKPTSANSVAAASNLAFRSEVAAPAALPPASANAKMEVGGIKETLGSTLPGTSNPIAAAPPALRKADTDLMQEAIRKIRNSPKQHYFVQFVALSSYADAREWREQYDVLRAALIAPVKNREGKLVYAIIAGPFPSNAKAMAFSNRKGMPEVNWVRTAGSMRDLLVAP